jgi:hypothetical protein
MRPNLHAFAATVVIGGWTISLCKGLITGDYAGVDIATPVMLVVVGYLFGDNLIRRRYEDGT